MGHMQDRKKHSAAMKVNGFLPRFALLLSLGAVLSLSMPVPDVAAARRDTRSPSVSITSPASGTGYTSDQTVSITASASDNTSVSKVEFYDGATLKGTDTTSPYSYSWTISSATNGSHLWTAKAYDPTNNVGTSTVVSLTVNIDNTPPTVSITSPASGTAYTTDQNVTIAAAASDNVGVAKVEFYDGATLKGTDTTSPYSYSWAVSSANNGSHNWTARAYDTSGKTATSAIVNLAVDIAIPAEDTTPPTASITSPASGTTYTTAQTVTIAAAASDNVGVAKVEFYDGTALKGTDTTSPYSYAWAFGAANNGSHSWMAKAYDAAGNSVTSSIVSLTVNIDGVPPTVSITSPESGTSYTTAQTVTIAATASDNVGVTWVEFYDGTVLKGTDSTSPYSYSWNVSSANNGNHSWTARAYDAAGNPATSAAETVTVDIASVTKPRAHVWSERYGATGHDYGRAVKVDSSGNVVTAGQFGGSTVDFGGGLLSNRGSFSLYIAKYTSAGSHVWSNAFGGSTGSSVMVHSLALDGNDNIVVTGFFTTSVDFGGGVLTSAGLGDIFIAKYSGADGSHLWSKRIGSTDADVGYAVAVDGSGNLLVTGSFRGTADFGGTVLTGYGMSLETFVAKYSSSGALLWAKRFLNNSDDEGRGIATDRSGNVFLIGRFSAKIDFGGGVLLTTAGGYDIFVAKLSSAGSHLWSKRFGGTQNNDLGFGIAVDGNGDAFITGQFDGTVDFGSGATYGWNDIFVGKYAGTNGAHLWSRTFWGSGHDAGNQVAVDLTGNVAVTGYFSYTVDFGLGSLISVGNTQDVFVAEFAGADGDHVWSEGFGGSGYEGGLSIAFDERDGSLVTTGYFQGSLDFGGGLLSSASGSVDVCLVKLAPN